MDKKIAGFTLIELMIVVAVLGLLAGIAVPKFAELIRKSNEGAIKGQLGSLRGALTVYYAENESNYPQGTATYVANITYLQNSLATKYLGSWPTCYVPPYHRKSDTVDNYPSFSDSWDTTCDGEWGYVGNKDNVSWGKIFVECWRTDTKTEQISSW